MDVSSINSDLIRGNVTTIILKALMGEDRYGYDILKEIEVKSGGQYKLKQPTLYSCLKRLEKQGLISSYWGAESDTEGGRRRYYALTDAGRAYLVKMQSEYEYSRTILDNLLSEEKFDFENKEAPFDINSLRPYTKRGGEDEDSNEAKKEEKPAAVVEKPAEETAAPVQPTKSAERPEPTDKTMFTPLDKGQSSYDEGYRHSSKSVFEMLGKIDEIMGKKTTETAEVVEENSEKETAVKAEETQVEITEKSAEPSVVPSAEEKPSPKPDSILTPREPLAPIAPIDSEEERIRRENAKRALGIGAFQEKKTDLESEDAAKKEEGTDILGKIDKLVGEEAEEKVEEKKFDLFSKIPIDQQLHPEKYADKNPIPTPAKAENTEVKREEIPADDPRMIFDKYNKKEPVAVSPEKEPAKVTIEPSPVPPASTFSFRKDTESVVNYRDAFGGLRKSDSTSATSEENDGQLAQKPASNIDLKTRLFSEGYKLRTYSRENTESYYSMNYIKKNRINRDCYALTYVLICLEVLFGWLIFKDRFTPIAYAAVCIAALLVPAIPFVIWTVNPDKRVRGSYNFRTSILNRLMLYLNLLVIDCLIGFFGFGANINDGNSMIAPILVPALLLLNIPLSSVVYLILYRTKKYHIS